MAGDGEGQRNNTAASASASGGTITVKASDGSWSPPAGSPWAQRTRGDPPGRQNPNQPYGCTYWVPPLRLQQMLGTGGTTPGQWVFVTCKGPGVINPMPPMWVTNAKAPAPVSPAVLAREAVGKLDLATPAIEMAPPSTSDQLVNVSTWLWVSPSAWRPLSARATAGPVTATATAKPAKVVWDMGDGARLTCAGPGTPYDPSRPKATTACSYTWSRSSAAQPGGDYEVTATVYWRVTWSAAGAKGGGNLGLVPGSSAHVAVRVAESEAINNAPGS